MQVDVMAIYQLTGKKLARIKAYLKTLDLDGWFIYFLYTYFSLTDHTSWGLPADKRQVRPGQFETCTHSHAGGDADNYLQPGVHLRFSCAPQSQTRAGGWIIWVYRLAATALSSWGRRPCGCYWTQHNTLYTEAREDTSLLDVFGLLFIMGSFVQLVEDTFCSLKSLWPQVFGRRVMVFVC